MKKKEFWLVIALILFGIVFNSVQKGKGLFYGSCSEKTSQKLEDPGFAVGFPQTDIRIATTGTLKRINISNPAGLVEITPATDGVIMIKPIIHAYHKNEKKARNIAGTIHIKQAIENDTLSIGVREESSFPYRRARVTLKCQIPPDFDIEVKNRLGDTDIQNVGKEVAISQWDGDLFVKNITGSARIKSYNGQVRLYDISGPATLSAANAKVKLKNLNSLNLKCSHTNVTASDIIEETEITHAGFSFISIENSGPISMKSEHSSATLVNIRGKVTISGSHGTLKLDKITGDISLTGKHCRINLSQIATGALTVNNTFNSVAIDGITANTLDFQLDTARLNMTVLELTGKASVKSHSSDVLITLPESIKPLLDISAYQGDVLDEINSGGEIKKENQKIILKTISGTPAITISTEYGDISLKKASHR